MGPSIDQRDGAVVKGRLTRVGGGGGGGFQVVSLQAT